jgi:hypothetical protein
MICDNDCPNPASYTMINSDGKKLDICMAHSFVFKQLGYQILD